MAITIITYLIMNILRTCTIHIFINNFLKSKRFSSISLCLVYIIYYVVSAYIFLGINDQKFIYNLYLNIFFIFLITMLYHSTWQKRLLCIVFIYILGIASEDCATAILTLLFQISLPDLLSNQYLTMIGIIFSTLLLFGLVLLVKPIFKKDDPDLGKTYWLAVFFIPSGFIYIFHALVQQLNEGKTNAKFVLIVLLILFSVNILVFFLYNKLVNDKAVKYENIMLLQQNDAYENQAQLIHSFQKNLREEKHDMKGYIAALKHLIEQKQYNESINYINDLIGRTNQIESGIHCGNPVIDAMVNSKLFIANNQNTQLDVRLNLIQSLDMDQVDLTTLLCNLLDNALEASLKVPANERMVLLQISYQHQTLSINVTNTYNPTTVNIRDGRAYTTKEDPTSHGIGLKRVKKVATKYNGTFEFTTLPKDIQHLFSADVILYIP